jgi:hypothetical protein
VTKGKDSVDARMSMKLVIIKKQLKSDSLKKKVEAINSLKENYKVAQIIKESSFVLEEVKSKKCELAIQALGEIEFIKLLFKEYPHKELIKAGGLLVRLLVISNNFGVEETEMMLSCYKGNPLVKYRIT